MWVHTIPHVPSYWNSLSAVFSGVGGDTVLDDETIKCFGGNAEGSLGLGDIIPRGNVPGQMGNDLPVVPLTFGVGGGAVSNAIAGGFHTCVSGTLGGMTCFGFDLVGQVRNTMYHVRVVGAFIYVCVCL